MREGLAWTQLDVANTTLRLLYPQCSLANPQLWTRGSCCATSDLVKGLLLGRILRLTREGKDGEGRKDGGDRWKETGEYCINEEEELVETRDWLTKGCTMCGKSEAECWRGERSE